MNEVRPGALDDSIDELRSQLQELRASRSRVVGPPTQNGAASSARSTTAPSSTWSHLP